MTPKRITVRELPVYPEQLLIEADLTADEAEPVYAPHPLAGQVDFDQLQIELGDAIWVGPGSKWALPWEAGVNPITVTADHAPAPEPADWARVANLCLNKAIKYNTGIYPTLGDIRTDLAGHDLATDDPKHETSHADLLLALANGNEYQA